jgi:transposase
MTSDTTNSPIHRLEIVETGRRRRFTTAEKLRIVKESHEGHRRVSATARRYGLLPAQLFSWRRQYEDGRLGAEADGDPVFVPAVVMQDGVSAPRPQHGGGRIEIVVTSGERVIIEGEVEEVMLTRVLGALRRR